MLAEQRYKEILHLLDRDGSVKTGTIKKILEVSGETVRRDLENMEAHGMIRRTRGGAMAADSLPGMNKGYVSFERRQRENQDYKEEVANLALDYIKEGEVIALDSGSTSLVLARAMKQRFHSLTVVTNSLAVVNELADTGITLIVTGGVYRPEEAAFASDIATLIFSKINVDTFFLTTCGISVDRGITYQRMDEVIVQNKMMEASRQTIVIADSTKLGCSSLVKMCDIECISMIITDSKVEKEQKEIFENAGIKVIIPS